MKKTLLLAAIAISANIMAQETLTDITPAAYDWANQPVGTKMVIKHYDTSWNTPFTFSYTLGGSEYLENGGCAQEELDFTTDASINDKIQINIFTNPDNTPRKQWIRCKIVLNIFSNEISTTDGVIGNMYFMDADNNNKHADLATYPENKINSAQFILYDEEGDPELDEDENYIYDKNRWLTFEVDFFIMDSFKGDNYAGRTSQDMPAKWKIYIPQPGLQKSTIFIKELKFYTIDGYTDDKDESNWPAYARAPHLSYGPCPDVEDGISEIRGSRQKGENAIFNLAGQRISKLQHGVNIVNGRKVLK